MVMFDPLRIYGAAGALMTYAGVCGWAWHRARRGRLPALPATSDGWTVVYASQTGTAESLARQAASALAGEGNIRCIALDQLTSEALQAGGRFLFVVSTHGQGEAPDNGRRFVSRCLGQPLDLSAMEFALLALGDRSYEHFCAFGQALAEWLAARGARQRFGPILVDRLDRPSLDAWHGHLVALGGGEDVEPPGLPDFQPWRLVARQHLNPGSAGGEVHRLRFEPVGHQATWLSGDLAVIQPPGDDERPREYSIASLATEGFLDLLVRRSLRPDGSPGLASGWLTGSLPVGSQVALQLRPHGGFRLNDNATKPALFIGNGVGLAGLRGHLAARIALGNRDNWLIFGERNAATDSFLSDEWEAWLAGGQLSRLDGVFSRDGGALRYVQDVLLAEADAVRDWVARGAAIYVCGSRRGMGEGVDAALRRVLGDLTLDALALRGAYCRDTF